MLTKQDKRDVENIVINVIQDAIIPSLDVLATKSDLKKGLQGVENRLDVVENRLDVVERKLDRVIDNQLENQGKLKNYDERIQKMEDAAASP